MATTGAPWNLPYPVSTDLVRDGAVAIENLAEATATQLDTTKNASNLTSGKVPAARLPIFAGRVSSNVPANSASFLAITWPTGRFSTAPLVAGQLEFLVLTTEDKYATLGVVMTSRTSFGAQFALWNTGSTSESIAVNVIAYEL
jgi:hypothetical protein